MNPANFYRDHRRITRFPFSNSLFSLIPKYILMEHMKLYPLELGVLITDKGGSI